MAKPLIEGEEKQESILSKITSFLKGKKGATEAKKEDDEMESAKADDEDAKKIDDDADAKKVDDDSEAKKEDDSDAEASKKTDDGEDDDDKDNPDEDDEDDSDEDDIEVNGEKVNLKDPSAARAAIEGLLKANSDQESLLAEAAAELGKKDAQISKTTEEVKKEIKSTFVPKSSKREKSIGTKEDEKVRESVMPEEGTVAYNIMKVSQAKAAAAKNATTKKS